MSGWRVAASCAGLLLLAGFAGRPAKAGESGDLLEAAQAWYAALDARDEARIATFYVEGAAGDPGRRDMERFRGAPLEFGAEVRSESGAEAWLQLHSGAGTWHLSEWKRGPSGWGIFAIVDLAPEMFLDRRTQPFVAAWPSDPTYAEVPAGIAYRLVLRLGSGMPSQKELESQFFRPSDDRDRAGDGALLKNAMSDSLPEVTSIVVTGEKGSRRAEGTLRGIRDFRLRLTETADGWRIVSASPGPERRAESEPAGQGVAVLIRARIVLAALEAKAAAAFAPFAADLTSPTPRAIPPERAPTRLAELRRVIGGHFPLLESYLHLTWSHEGKRVGIHASRPDGAGDPSSIALEMVRAGDTWLVLDVHSGLVTLVIQTEK